MQSVKVELFGRELLLAQRSIRDIIDASLYDSDKTEDKLFLNAFIIYSGLKINWDKKTAYKFYQFRLNREQKQMQELLSVKNIMSNISITEMNELCTKIYELDFGKPDEKKKAGAPQTSAS